MKGQCLEKARSPPVFQLPLDCTYCRTSTGGDETHRRCKDGLERNVQQGDTVDLRDDALQWMQPSMLWATLPRGSTPQPPQRRGFLWLGRIETGFRVLVARSPLRIESSGFM